MVRPLLAAGQQRRNIPARGVDPLGTCLTPTGRHPILSRGRTISNAGTAVGQHCTFSSKMNKLISDRYQKCSQQKGVGFLSWLFLSWFWFFGLFVFSVVL